MKKQINSYRLFHEREPDKIVVTKNFWQPGSLVLVGSALDTGYRIDIEGSAKEKDQEYVHDHKDGVKLYRRARRGERPDKILPVREKSFPLGRWLGVTYRDEDGNELEIAGGRLRAISPHEKFLYVSDGKGIKYVITGGKFRITDWMYD